MAAEAGGSVKAVASREPARGVKKPKPPFDALSALNFALERLNEPSARADIVRRDRDTGPRVARWVLPLELCPGGNAYAEMESWQRKQIKDAAYRLMFMQSGGHKATTALRGRPVVLCVRFSSKAPDERSDWSKIPVDRLLVGKPKRPNGMPDALWQRMRPQLLPTGLCWLRDDSPSAIDLRCWWEPAPPGKGCVFVELCEGVGR